MLLASLFTDHMVLQRDRENPIWGSDLPGQPITLSVSGQASLELEAHADPSGDFELRCPPLAAGGPYRITLTGSSRVVLEDVWVGEVWLASGQSNMEWPLRATNNAAREAAGAHFPEIRTFKVARAAASEPAQRVVGEWTPCSPNTAEAFSAVAYYFARELQARLGVPIGIIDATWGGTSIDAWLSIAALRQVDATTEARLSQLAREQGHLPRLRAEHAAAVRAWELAMLPHDPPNEGQRRGWARADFDDQAWPLLRLPSFWQHHGLAFNGVVWFRRELELPASAAGHELWLELGAIDDFDHTYFNGELVGSHPDGTPNAYQLPRRYRVPGALVRAGKNSIAVRVFDHFGEGGFVGPSAAMFAHSAAGLKLSLSGDWHYAVEHEIALVSGDVFKNFPATPLALSVEGRPAALHHGMLAPLFPYGIRGALWYQGETDAGAHAVYAARQRALVRELRACFEEPSLPFLLVQLAGFRESVCWPYLREAQSLATDEPGVALATALDVGDPHDIHPKDKQTVGKRLALLARAQVYGEHELVAQGPTFQRLELAESKARIHYRHATGLRARAERIVGFEIAAADGVFHDADARIDGESALVESAAVPEPRFVRYAWQDYSEANLENAAGLPALPFRTDRLACPNHPKG